MFSMPETVMSWWGPANIKGSAINNEVILPDLVKRAPALYYGWWSMGERSGKMEGKNWLGESAFGKGREVFFLILRNINYKFFSKYLKPLSVHLNR